MNSPLNERVLGENGELLTRRFPELSAALALDTPEGRASLARGVPESWQLEATPSGLPTLRIGNTYLHSRYDPRREAGRIARDPSRAACGGFVFLSPGLAYGAEETALLRADAPIVLVIPDIYLFALLLSSRPLDTLLAHPGLAIVVGLPPAETRSVLEGMGALEYACLNPGVVPPGDRTWLEGFRALEQRNARKEEINRNTLRRFGRLWLRNMTKNLGRMRDLGGIRRFELLFPDTPALLLAAGPSLDEILPMLPELSRRCVVIAVDTALRACLRSGVEPDFLVLVDPQYWNYRHLDGLEASRTVMITESAAWPAVFRFPAKAHFLCSSLFPLGRFLEQRTRKRGELGAGGSVATTAWDFARHLGCPEIFVAGLDLAFPRRQTHFKGSLFEERAHGHSRRLEPAELESVRALYGAGPYPVADRQGGTVLTDKRLSLYAWWFESRIAAYPAHRTASLTSGGMMIPGIPCAEVGSCLDRPPCREEIANRIGRAAEAPEDSGTGDFYRGVNELIESLEDLSRLANRAEKACGRRDARELDRIDREILTHPAKEIAAMIFDAAGAEPSDPSEGSREDPFLRSQRIYRAVGDASGENIRGLEFFLKNPEAFR